MCTLSFLSLHALVKDVRRNFSTLRITPSSAKIYLMAEMYDFMVEDFLCCSIR